MHTAPWRGLKEHTVVLRFFYSSQKYEKSVRIMNRLRMTSMWNHQLWMAIADPQAVAQTEICWLWLMTKSSLTTRGPDSWVMLGVMAGGIINETCTCINTMFLWVCFDYLYSRMEDHSTSLVSGSCSCQWSPFECYCGDIETIILRPVQNFLVETWVNELYYIAPH